METFLELPYVYPVSVINEHGMLTAQTQNLNVITTDIGSQRWSFFIQLKTIWGYSEKAGELLAHRIENSYDKPFEMMTPVITNHRLPAENLRFMNVGARAVNIDTVTVSGSNVAELRAIPAGNFIRFGDKTKIYMITKVSSSGSNQVWNIKPRLRENVSDSERIHVNPNMLVKYSPGSPQSLAFEPQGWVRPNMQIIEHL